MMWLCSAFFMVNTLSLGVISFILNMTSITLRQEVQILSYLEPNIWSLLCFYSAL